MTRTSKEDERVCLSVFMNVRAYMSEDRRPTARMQTAAASASRRCREIDRAGTRPAATSNADRDA